MKVYVLISELGYVDSEQRILQVHTNKEKAQNVADLLNEETLMERIFFLEKESKDPDPEFASYYQSQLDSISEGKFPMDLEEAKVLEFELVE